MTLTLRSTEHASRRRAGTRHGIRCTHLYPILVTPFDEGRRARCLGCGAVGPARAICEDARLALLAMGSLSAL